MFLFNQLKDSYLITEALSIMLYSSSRAGFEVFDSQRTGFLPGKLVPGRHQLLCGVELRTARVNTLLL